MPPGQILNALLGNMVDLSTIKKVMMLLRTLRMFKLMRKFKVGGGCSVMEFGFGMPGCTRHSPLSCGCLAL